MTIDHKARLECEELIYTIMDTLDKSKTNSDYYRTLFAQMTDEGFYKFFTKRLPLRFHYEPFKIEPKMYEITEAYHKLGVPLFEKINVPHIYTNKQGKPVKTKEALIIVINIKRLKQMVTHKSHVALNTEKRDMKTGLLTSEDKGAKQTDREFEALTSYGLDFTIEEYSRARADSLKAGNEMDKVIATKGFVSNEDIHIEKNDSLSKNLLNVYLLGANIYSNIIDTDYMTPYTAKNKQKAIERL